jgi:NADPH:quinone reductase-like Zn-dependent oxidoreductase
MLETDAWLLDAGTTAGEPGRLRRDTVRLPDLRPHEVLVEPLYGSWEANLSHAVARSPVDVCRLRDEEQVIIGNLGIVRAVRLGSEVDSVREGDVCMVIPISRRDRYGYTELVYAYDCPGTYGLLAKQTKVAAELLLPVPHDSRHSLPQWATYGRYFTAWDNWRVALGAWRAQLPDEDPADHLVFGWGGGTALAELELAHRHGFRVAMAASTDSRIEALAAQGVTPVDRRLFPDLAFDEREAADPDYRHRYRLSEKAFLDIVGELSGGRGVSIMLDNIGGAMYKATLKALGRAAVLSSVGWKDGMNLRTVRATECIRRHLHVHTHVWRFTDSAAIRDFQEESGWIRPAGGEVVYGFDDIGRLSEDHEQGRISSYFPLYTVNAR